MEGSQDHDVPTPTSGLASGLCIAPRIFPEKHRWRHCPSREVLPTSQGPPAAVTRPQEALLFTPEEPGSLLPGGSPALTSWAQVPSAAQLGVGPKRQLAGD